MQEAKTPVAAEEQKSEEVTSPGTISAVLGGELRSGPTDNSTAGSINSSSQSLQVPLQASEKSGLAQKAVPKGPKTYAQAMKGAKNVNDATNETVLGLSERDINVQR